MGTEVSKHTPLPWSWGIHDYSLASLTGPKEEEDHVLSVSPCKACMEGAKRKSELPTWQWGRCTTPSLADAEFIVAAVNGYEPMRKALEAFMALPHLDDDICEVGSGCKVCAAIEQARAGLAGK